MTTQFSVPDATCGHCKTTIEGAVDGIEGVASATLDLDSKVLRVEHADVVSTQIITAAIAEAGYTVDGTSK